jgi:hypothetical protein
MGAFTGRRLGNDCVDFGDAAVIGIASNLWILLHRDRIAHTYLENVHG